MLWHVHESSLVPVITCIIWPYLTIRWISATEHLAQELVPHLLL